MVSVFDRLSDIPPRQIWASLTARPVHGERITLAVVEVEPGADLPEHSHDNEQLGMVLRGSLTLRVGDEERALGPGETWRIPPGIPHSGVGGPEGAEVVDVFAPPRADWSSAEELSRRRPRWP
jgi:quercetin dioxygenase-like cupin family protein